MGMAQLEKGQEIMHSCRKKRIMGKRRMAEKNISYCQVYQESCWILGLGILIYHPSEICRSPVLISDLGKTISIQLPQGQNFLIDGGSSNKKNIAHYQILPFLKSGDWGD